MLNAKNNFDLSFQRIRRLDAFYLHLVNVLHIPAADLEDILRSEIVYAVSSLDRLIHDVVKRGMIAIYEGRRTPTIAYQNYELSISQHANIDAAGSGLSSAIFNGIIENKHGHLTFQTPDKIKDALNLIWNEQYKWQRIASVMGQTEDVVKTTLNNIVIRRNQIAHEMDLDLLTSTPQTITYPLAKTMVDFIEVVGNTIYGLL
jgi:hypothetical protein